jgi:DNA primase small subunit
MTETTKFLKQKFSEYYKNNELIYPNRFGRREFGFMFFDRKGMTRHIGFKTGNDIKSFLVKNVPMHAYYSSAYYEKPDASTMAQKKWLGADLIFDLDADHIEPAKGLSYEEMLNVVKSETLKLLENFILNDFGFDEKDVSVNFSGGRGYHIHVTDPKIFSLDSSARREIVDYVEGIGLENVFMERAYDAKQYAHKTYVKKPGKEMPKPDAPGWRGKIGRGTHQLCDMLEKMGREKAVKYLTTRKIGRKAAEGIYSDLFDGRGVDKIKNGRIDVFSKNAYLESFVKTVSEEVKINVRGTADEPVTSDIKRLIRLNSSLHGKTGLKVMQVNIDELKKFNPLNDAVVFSDEPVNIEVVKPVKISMRKKNFNLKKGENTVPEFLGIFLMGRGFAKRKRENTQVL